MAPQVAGRKLLFLLWMWLMCCATNAQPDNDDFSRATRLAGTSADFLIPFGGASLEEGEPTPLIAGQPVKESVWFSWASPLNGIVSLEFPNASGVRVFIYVGTNVANLKSIATTLDNPPSSSITHYLFRVTGRINYRIAVAGGAGDWRGEIPASLRAFPVPTNDAFSQATALLGTNVQSSAIVPATFEVGEPGYMNDLTGGSLWWSWTAPETGSANIRLTSSTMNGFWFAFAGDTLDSLKLLDIYASTNQIWPGLVFSAEAGASYHFAFVGRTENALGWVAIEPRMAPLKLVATIPGNGLVNGDNLRLDFTQLPITLIGFEGLIMEKIMPSGTSTLAAWERPFPSSYILTNVAAGDLQLRLRLGRLPRFPPTPSGFSLNSVVPIARRGPFPELVSVPVTVSVRHSNDNFADALQIGGVNISEKADLRGATLEVGEPPPSPFGDPPPPFVMANRSVWFKWTAPRSGWLHPDGNWMFELFTGTSLTALDKVPSSLKPNPMLLTTVYFVEEGMTYYLRVSSSAEYEARLQASLLEPEVFGPPLNDNFANALPLQGSGSVSLPNMREATLELNEPNADLTGTVWYKYAPAVNGELSINFLYNISAQLYLGSSLGELAPLTARTNYLRISVMQGKTYYLQIANRDSTSATGELAYRFHPHPPNDNFVGQLPIQLGSRLIVSLAGATLEPNEPPSESARSIWFSLTAAETGFLHIGTVGGTELFTGETLPTLQAVEITPKRVFPVQAGVNYKLRLLAGVHPPDSQELSVQFFLPTLAADSSSAPMALPVHSKFTVPAFLATASNDDPELSFQGGLVGKLHNTAWFEWTAPADGEFRMGTDNAAYWLAIFRITPGNDMEIIASGTALNVRVLQGQNYKILLGIHPGYSPEANVVEVFSIFYTMALISPLPDAAFSPQETIQFSTTEPQPGVDPPIQELTFTVKNLRTNNGFQAGTLSQPPFSMSLSNLPTGNYVLWTEIRTPLAQIGLDSREFHIISTNLPHDQFVYPKELPSLHSIENVLSDTELAEATWERGEPLPPRTLFGPNKGTLWFRWTAPASGEAYASSAPYWGTDGKFYEGDSLETLKEARKKFPATSSYIVEKGHTYRIQLFVGGVTARNWKLSLESFKIVEPADNFLFTEDTPVSFKIETTELTEDIAAFSIAWNGQTVARSPAPPWELSAHLSACIGYPHALLHLNSGEDVVRILPFTTVVPANVSPARARVLSPDTLEVNFAGFVPPTNPGNTFSGPPLFFRYTPARPEFISFPQSKLAVTNLVTGEALEPVNYEWELFNLLYELEAGVEYLLSLSEPRVEGGRFVLSTAPANDNLADALPLPFSITWITNAFAATVQPAEPSAGYPSVWYFWNAPADGFLAIETTRVRLFAGMDFANLQEISPWSTAGFRRIFQVIKGQPYRVAVYANPEEFNLLFLNAAFHGGDAGSDAFESASTLSGTEFSHKIVYNSGTYQPGEPIHAGELRRGSVWWNWVAPVTGRTYLWIEPASYFHSIAVYTGTTLSNLLEAAMINPGTPSWFNSTAGTTYHFAFDSRDSRDMLELQLQLRHFTRPPNDDLSQAQILAGNQVTIRASHFLAGREPNEPLHAEHYGGRSLWYRWHAPDDGKVTLQVRGVEFFGASGESLLAIYQGDSLANLFPIASSTRRPMTLPFGVYYGGETNKLSIPVQSGQSYTIALDWFGTPDEFFFDLEFQPDPVEITLGTLTESGLPVTIRGTRGKAVLLQTSGDLEQWDDFQVVSAEQSSAVFLPFALDRHLFLRAVLIP